MSARQRVANRANGLARGRYPIPHHRIVGPKAHCVSVYHLFRTRRTLLRYRPAPILVRRQRQPRIEPQRRTREKLRRRRLNGRRSRRLERRLGGDVNLN